MPRLDRILITGASGFVGGHLLPAIRAALPAAEIIVAGRGEAIPAGMSDRQVYFDLFDVASIRQSVDEALPDAVIHLAARSHVGESLKDPLSTWQMNTIATIALGEAVLARVPECRLLYVSSAEVYGGSFQSGVPLAETAAVAPANPYAASKAAAEVALGEMKLRGLKAICMRPFAHTGPGQSDAFVVPAFARQIAEIEAGVLPPIIRTGALDRWRDYIDVRDVCAAYLAAITADHLEDGSVFNVCTGNPRRIGDVLDTLIALSSARPEVVTDASRIRPNDVISYCGDPARIQASLGWHPSRRWEDTLSDVLNYWRQIL